MPIKMYPQTLLDPNPNFFRLANKSLIQALFWRSIGSTTVLLPYLAHVIFALRDHVSAHSIPVSLKGVIHVSPGGIPKKRPNEALVKEPGEIGLGD